LTRLSRARCCKTAPGPIYASAFCIPVEDNVTSLTLKTTHAAVFSITALRHCNCRREYFGVCGYSERLAHSLHRQGALQCRARPPTDRKEHVRDLRFHASIARWDNATKLTTRKHQFIKYPVPSLHTRVADPTSRKPSTHLNMHTSPAFRPSQICTCALGGDDNGSQTRSLHCNELPLHPSRRHMRF
jgi:hypothetical protein